MKKANLLEEYFSPLVEKVPVIMYSFNYISLGFKKR